MSRSARFRQLESNLRRLTRDFLPPTFDPLGIYSDRLRSQARAYRVLAHAEFESYLEDVTIALADKAWSRWKKANKASTVLMAVLAFYDKAQPAIPTNPAKPITDLEARIALARNEFARYVKVESHGIRRPNVLKLLLSVGINESEIDATWLATVDSFGEQRGNVAHNPYRTMSVIDPKTEADTVLAIVTGLERIDERLKNMS